MFKTLAQLQKNMPADKKAEHDAMTKAQATKAAKDLEAHADMIAGLGIDPASDIRERQHYFELLAASKA